MSSFSFASTEINTIQMSTTTITDYISNGNSDNQHSTNSQMSTATNTDYISDGDSDNQHSTNLQMSTTTNTDIISEGDIDKHHWAILQMRECIEYLGNLVNPNRNVVSGISNGAKVYLSNFKLNKLKIKKIFDYLTNLIKTWDDFKKLRVKKNNPKIKENKDKLIKSWNICLNKLRGCLTNESFLNDLLFFDKNYGMYKYEEGEPRTFIDIQTFDLNEKTDVRLHLNIGRIFADSSETMCSRLIGLLESVHDPSDLLVEYRTDHKSLNWIGGSGCHTVTFGVWISIQWSDTTPGKNYGMLTDRISRVNTNEPKFLEHFLGGSFPKYNEVQRLLQSSDIDDLLRYDRFYKLVKLMRVKIMELINLSSLIPNSIGGQFAVIRCPRTEPILCGCETVIQKPKSLRRPYICSNLLCNMELCPWGCGRAHHGGSCEIPLDQASADLIAQSTKTCPGCNFAVHKFEGCNHITCRCRVQFCWICGNEYDRDEHGHYRVTEHHQDLGNDGLLRCRQFDR
jgi:hypothetical protein